MTEYWFQQKRRGYGAGLPIHWKGWVALGLYVGTILAMPLIFGALRIPDAFLYRVISLIVLSVPFFYLAWKKTEGGWRWRSGEDENEDGD